MKNQFSVEKSEIPNFWECVDNKNGIKWTFEDKKFSETKNHVILNEYNGTPYEVSRIQLETWLLENHSEKLHDVKFGAMNERDMF